MATTPIEMNGVDKLQLTTNVAPVAGISGAILSLDFRVTVAQPLASDPISPVAGQFWLNTTSPKTLKYYDGAAVHGIAPLDNPHFTGQVGIGTASPIATLEISGAVAGAIAYGLLLDDQTAGTSINYNIWSGPVSSTLSPEIVGYINGSIAGPNGNRNVFINEVDSGSALFGISQATGGVGLYGVSCATLGGNVWGFGGDGVSIATGPTATVAGGWAEAGNQGTGRVDTLVGLQLLQNWNSGGGFVTNCYGLQVTDQTVGDNNYGILIQQSPGANNYAIIATGGAQSKFTGQVDITATSTAYRFVGKKTPILVVAGVVTLDASAASSFRVALTANVTSSTITNPTDGQVIVIEWVQDATGGRTVVMPANISGAATPTATANAVTTQSFIYDLTATTWYSVGVGSGGGGGTGTVTSVGLALPAEFTVSGSPVTTTGTLTAVWASETANKVFAAPNGAPGTPTFRLLVAADIPNIAESQVTNLTTDLAAKVPNTRQILNGTGITGGGDLSADRTLSVVANTTNQKVIVDKSGVLVGTRKELNFIPGTNVTLTVADNSGSDRVDVTIAASGGGSTPTVQTVPDLIHWFSADNQFNSNNQKCPSWRDPSTFTSLYAPSGVGANYLTGQINSLPACQFPGTSSGRYGIANAYLLTACTVFAVFKPATLTGQNNYMCSGLSGALEFRTTGANLQLEKSNVSSIATDTTTLVAGTWYQVNAKFDGTNFAFRVNRVAGASGANATTLTANMDAVGWNRATAGGDSSLFLAELIVYARALGSTEITTIETYLNGKYGL